MVHWHSPEEAEAWWSEFEQLKQKVAKLEKRIVINAEGLYRSFILQTLNVIPKKDLAIWQKRADDYIEKISKCDNESEMAKHYIDFTQEVSDHFELPSD